LRLALSANIDAAAAGTEGVRAALADDQLGNRLAVGIEQAHERRLGVLPRRILEREQRPALLGGSLGLDQLGLSELHDQRAHLVRLHGITAALLQLPLFAGALERQLVAALGELDAAQRTCLSGKLRKHRAALDAARGALVGR
jgi:hypothetical protein